MCWVFFGVVQVAHATISARAFAFSGDGVRLVTQTTDSGTSDSDTAAGYTYSCQFEVWDVRTGKSVFRPAPLHNQSAAGAALSPDGRYLAVGMSVPQPSKLTATNREKRGQWMLWDVEQKRMIRQSIVDYGLASVPVFSPDGLQFALHCEHEDSTGDYDGSKVFLVDTFSGKTLRTYKPGWAATYGMAFSPDSSTLALCGEIRPGKTLPFRYQPPLGIVQLWDAHVERLQQTFTQVDCSLGPITFSPQGDILLCTRTLQNRAVLDEQARILTQANGSEPVEPRPLDKVTQADANRNFVAWDLKTGKSVLWHAYIEGPDVDGALEFASAQFASDGRTLLGIMSIYNLDPNSPPNSGYSETRKTVRIWKFDKVIFDNSVPPSVLSTVVLEESRSADDHIVSPDGSTLAATDTQANLHFWNSATGRLTGKSWKLTP